MLHRHSNINQNVLAKSKSKCKKLLYKNEIKRNFEMKLTKIMKMSNLHTTRATALTAAVLPMSEEKCLAPKNDLHNCNH